MRTIILSIIFFFISSNMFAETQTNLQEWQKPEKTGFWYQLEAGYYVIWYEKKDEQIAYEIADAGQAMYEDFKDILGDKIPPKVYVQIQSRTGYANGSYTPVPPTINFYTYSMPYDTKGYNWNYRLLVHELLHYMQLEYRGGVSNITAMLFGPAGRAIFGLTPMFGIEGFATAIESDYTSSGRYQNPIFTMPFRADILLDNADTYHEATRMQGEDFHANYGKSYQYGLQFITYIRAHYGYEAAAKIWQNFMKFPFGYSQQYSKDLGVNFDDIYQGMIDEAKEKYSPYQHWSRGKEFEEKNKKSDNSRALYSILGKSDQGVLVYQAGADIKEGYLLFDPAAQKLTPLFYKRAPFTDSYDTQTASITKDGNSIAYVLPVRNTDYLGNMSFIRQEINFYNDLYIYNISQKNHTRLTYKQQLSTPVISADGSHIYATQFTRSGNYGRLIKINTSNYTQGFEVIYEQPQSMVFYKSLSPDGKKLVFVERSPNFGIKLQLLDLSTRKTTTLIQRDYGLWITSPHFIDNTHISIVADIEHSTENTVMYQIDISNKDAPVWKRLGQDKVGFHSAVLTENSQLVYSSHNGRGFSIFTYDQSQVQSHTTPININAIPLPDFYQDDNIRRYLNGEHSVNSDSPSPQQATSTPDVLQYKKRLVWGVLPSRVEYYYPFFFSDFSNNTSISYQIAFKGVTQRSQLRLGASYYFKQHNIGYNATYRYASELLGTFALKSERKYTYACSIIEDIPSQKDSTCTSQYTHKLNNEEQIHGLEWSRILLYTPSNFYVSARANTNFVVWRGTNEQYQPVSHQYSTRFTSEIPFGWRKRLYSRNQLSHDLMWRVSPGLSYIPSILDIEQNQVRIFNGSQVTIPTHRKLAFKISNFSLWDSQPNQYIRVNQLPTSTLRLSRVNKPILYSNLTSTFHEASISKLDTPFQSSFAIDILISFMNINAGNYLFEPYALYTNIFVEQTFGIDSEHSFFQVDPQLITGIENGLRIGIIAITLDLTAGVVLQIPYNQIDVTPRAFISIGTGPLAGIMEIH